jgi:DNA polymerase III epsilon subunit-like protein
MKYYLISFDCETTGLSVIKDQIVEFGAIIQLWDSVSLEIVSLPSFAQYAKPTTVGGMTKRAEEITGITTHSLQSKPPIKEVLADFLIHLEQVCNDLDITRLLLSYNGFAYDIPLVVAEIERYGGSSISYFRQLRIRSAVDVLPLGRTCLDTTTLKRKANGSCSYKLGDVYFSVCNCTLENAHGALADSQAVLDIVHGEGLCGFFQTLVSDLSETNACKNPMILVRAILGRQKHTGTKTSRNPNSSKRVLDMFSRHTQQREQKKLKLNC